MFTTIENYLLEPKFVDEALGRLGISHNDLSSLGKIDQALRHIAKNQIGKLVSHRIKSDVNSDLIKELNLNANPLSGDIAADLHKAMEKSVERINAQLETSLHLDDIRGRVDAEQRALNEALDTEDWKKHFRGRDILQEFAGQYLPGMRYIYFRELIISQMVSAGYKPPGMKAVLDQIVDD